jgi:hypothetical protein
MSLTTTYVYGVALELTIVKSVAITVGDRLIFNTRAPIKSNN